MNISHAIFLSQILYFCLFFGVKGQSSFSKLLKLSCEGNIWQADKQLRQYDTADALHCLSAFEFILRGNSSGAVFLHKLAKQRNSTLIPPLASLHLSGEPCNGLGDIFYVTAVIIKQLVDSNIDQDVLLNGHKTLITLLSDSGLSEEAEIHLQAALKINPTESNIRIRSLLMFPIVYKSAQNIINTRLRLQSRLDILFEDKNYTLAVLDEFTLSPTFYLIYQGFNDKSYLQLLHKLYQQAHPALALSEVSSNFPKLKHMDNNDILNTPTLFISQIDNSITTSYNNVIPYTYHRKIRIGFVSAHFRTHSICKLFCGIITHLNTSQYDIFVFSALQEQHEDAMTWQLSKNVNIRFIRIGMTLIQNRREVVNRNIDILVYLDIGMDPATSTWSAARLAPIQVCTWGHPSTTGQGTIDYYLSYDYFHYGHDIYLSPTYYETNNNNNSSHSSSSSKFTWQYGHDSVSHIKFDNAINNINIKMPYDNLMDFHQAIHHNNNNSNSDHNDYRYTPDRHQPLQRQVHADPQSVFSEQLILLEDLGIHFQRPDYPPHVTDRIINETAYHQYLLHELISTNGSQQIQKLLQLKLQTSSTFLVCPQHLPKFHPFFDEVLHTLLLLSSNQTYIVILAPSTKKGIWKLLLERRWRKKFGTQNYQRILWINPLNSREFMILMALSDVMLDPFPFGGGVTTLEALATCTPVVTLPRLQSVPALAAGMLVKMIHQINMKEQQEEMEYSNGSHEFREDMLLQNLIVSSASDYIKAVLQLLPEYSPEMSSTILKDFLTTSQDGLDIAYLASSTSTLLSTVKATICKYNYILYNSYSSVTAWELFLNRVVRSYD